MVVSLSGWRWALLAALPCLALRCREVPPCLGQYQGGLSLRPGSSAWLPTPAPDSLCFLNSNGYRAVLDRVTTPAGADSVTLPAFTNTPSGYREEYLNPDYPPCPAYFRARRGFARYQGRTLNLDLRFNLFKNLTTGTAPPVPLTRAAADTLADLVGLAFNEQYYAEFPVASRPYRQPRPTPLGGTAVYLDSVQLTGRKFFGVYEFTRTPTGAAVQPQRFYFQPGRGLVGFTYTNHEQWARL